MRGSKGIWQNTMWIAANTKAPKGVGGVSFTLNSSSN